MHHRFNVVFHPRSFSMFIHKVHGAIVKGCRVAERNNPLWLGFMFYRLCTGRHAPCQGVSSFSSLRCSLTFIGSVQIRNDQGRTRGCWINAPDTQT